MDPIRIAIVDDHRVFLQGLRACFRDYPHLHVLIESCNGKELLDQLYLSPVDIVVMDIHMPVMDGITATLYIKEHFPEIRVLGLSVFMEQKCITNILRAGASGYLVKSASPEEIILAIQTIYETGVYFNQYLSRTLLRQFHCNPDLISLNAREQEILTLVCEELSNTEIAKKLYVSKRTIEGYRSKLLEKCGVKNVAGLVLYAVKYGLVAQ